MVRLEVQVAAQKETITDNFNSTMVRLEVAEAISASLLPILFQFHTGTIRSRIAVSQFAWVLYFNSTQVRLEELLNILFQ